MRLVQRASVKKLDITHDTASLSDTSSDTSYNYNDNDVNDGSNSFQTCVESLLGDVGDTHDDDSSNGGCSISSLFKHDVNLGCDGEDEISYENAEQMYENQLHQSIVFEHVDSFELYRNYITLEETIEKYPSGSIVLRHVDSLELYLNKSAQSETENEDDSSAEDSRNTPESDGECEKTGNKSTVDNEWILLRISNPHLVALTDHIEERMYERGFNSFDFRKVIQYGCRRQETGGHWRFTYNRILAITDSEVQVGITMYKEWRDTKCVKCDTNKNTCACGFCKGCCTSKDGDALDETNPGCSGCGWRGKEFCNASELICEDCCPGCDTCLAEECPKCNRKEIDLLCDKGFCPDCCDGCMTCSGQRCPCCRVEGMNILCGRGFCEDCCYGCSYCRCPCCHVKTDLCERGYCSKCCWGCKICLREECPKCKRKELDLLCDKGLCPDCCDGCITCSGQSCPCCGDKGMDILCNRGYCHQCCFGCSICR